MTLITRQTKGSKLTIQEMDGNLEYLDSKNVDDVDYIYSSNDLIIKRPNSSEDIIQIYSYNLDRKSDINTSSIYEDSFYKEFEEPTNKFAITYNENGIDLPVLYNSNSNLTANLGYWVDNVYNNTSFNSSIISNTGYIPDGFFIGTGFNSSVNTISIQSDGKILVGGQFTTYNGVSLNRIIRLNSDGSQDTSFVIGTGFSNTVNTISIQSDGKILVGGSFTSYNGVSSNRIIRLNSDGSQDSSFVIGTGFNNTVNTITIQSDGKILVGGWFASYNGVTSNRIIRLNTDGSQDSSFVIGTGFNNPVNTISIQSDGKILVGGQFTSYNGVSLNRIIRLNTDGSQDSSFVIGTGFNNIVNTITIQSDGKILVGGSFNSYNGVVSTRIIRLNSDGSNNVSINSNTVANNLEVKSIVIQSDGKILLCGDKYVGRLNTDGTQDISFNYYFSFNGFVNSIAIQSDGKILAGGSFDGPFNGNGTIPRIIRLNSDGTSNNSPFEFNKTIQYKLKTDDSVFELITEDNQLMILSSKSLQKVVLSYRLLIDNNI
jgi:uncharacterized delta-60 repeat protein